MPMLDYFLITRHLRTQTRKRTQNKNNHKDDDGETISMIVDDDYLIMNFPFSDSTKSDYNTAES